jgi:hypothetical protein
VVVVPQVNTWTMWVWFGLAMASASAQEAEGGPGAGLVVGEDRLQGDDPFQPEVGAL